jgi:hypothetical protein
MAGNTRWFVVASPTGSTEGEFFFNAGTGSINQSGSKYINLSAVADFGGVSVPNWGTVNNFPTYSAYSPGLYVRDYINSPYTSSIYTYLDSDDATSVTSIQQDLQKIFFPGIVTGSYNGIFVTSASVNVGSNGQIALFDPNLVTPINYNGIQSMSFFTTDIAGVSQNTMLNNANPGDQIILRNVTENESATYNIITKNTGIGIGIVGYSVTRLSGDSAQNPNLQSLFDADFVKTGSNQQTFYIVGVANPATGLPFVSQSTVGISNAFGDLRSGIIKVYATESNNTSDWNRLLRTVTADNGATFAPASSGPSYVALNHNLFMFTASAGNSGSWELLVDTA